MRVEAKPFSKLTEGAWRPIRNEVVRWGRDANDTFLWRMGPLSLRSCLEAELRGCLRFLQRPKDKRGKSKTRAALIGYAKRLEAIRSALMKLGVTGDDHEDADQLLQKLSRILSRKIESVASRPSRSNYGAGRIHLDLLFKHLIDICREIGGPVEGSSLINFIQACADPAVGRSAGRNPASHSAISRRIKKFRRQPIRLKSIDRLQVSFGPGRPMGWFSDDEYWCMDLVEDRIFIFPLGIWLPIRKQSM